MGVLTFINDEDTELIGVGFSMEPGDTLLKMMHFSNNASIVAKESQSLFTALRRRATLSRTSPEAVDELASNVETLAESAEAMLAGMGGDLEFIRALAEELGALESVLNKVDRELNRD